MPRLLERYTLNEDLMGVGDESSRVSQRQASVDQLRNGVVVLPILLGRPEVSWGKYFAGFGNGAVLFGGLPLSVEVGQLLNCVLLLIVEDTGEPRAIDDQHGIDQAIAYLGANQLLLVLLPDGDDRAHGEVGVDDGAAVQWVVGDDIVART